MQSKFSLVSGKYLFHDDKAVVTILNTRYARPLLSRMEQLEVEEGTESALQILCHLATQEGFSDRMRISSAEDHAAVRASVTGSATRYGHKHTCVYCTQKFFDLNGKVDRCPSCKTAIKLEV